jgi:aminoglycoside phosphotransferase family enzyme/predicted kinase
MIPAGTPVALHSRGARVMHKEAGQADAIQLLSDPATHGGAVVQRIDTHASVVFLAADRAYKLKRAVKYDYLDFSTLDLRKRFCEAELRINRRIAPALYRRIVPVVRTSAGALTLDGEGTPVEWVIEMVRFDQEALFDRMAAAGRLDLHEMAPLAEEIASFHETCAVRPEFGGDAAIARVIDGNAAGFREFGRDVFDTAAPDALTLACRSVLQRHRQLLQLRRETGYVRECHGDLHLGNIVLWAGRPTLFDAIEFNDDIACIDVMYDLAFLLMDLWHRALPQHANRVLNAYLQVTRDFDGLAALPLFLACRAAIRAKTSATAASLQTGSGTERESEMRAREYLELAGRLLQRQRPTLVAIGGLSGTGKSTLARALAPSVGAVPGAVVVRSDEIRKRLWGVTPLTKLGAAAYTPEMSTRVYETLAADAEAVARTGHSVIVDAVCAREGDRLAIERAARAAGVAFAGIWLEAPEPVLLERVTSRGPDVSDADAAVVRMQCAQSTGDVRWLSVDAAADIAQVIVRARGVLQRQMVALDAAA